MIEESETPTLSEAFEQATETLTTTTDEAQPVTEETVQESTPDVSKDVDEAVENSVDKSIEETTTEETPLDKFNPEELSPELQKVYKDMQKGFTQGRQKDREELNALKKEVAEMRQKSPEQINKEWQAMTPEQKIEKLAEEKVLETKLDDFRTTALEEYNKIDPRLDDSEGNESYDEIMDTAIRTQLDQLLEDHVSINGNELGFDYKTHVKELTKQWDEYINNNFDRKIAKQREMAKKKEMKNQKSNPKASSSTQVNPSSTMSLEDAVGAAFSKISG